MIHPNYEDFRYTGVSDVDAVTRSRVSFAAPTGETTHGVDQRLQTFVSTPTKLLGNEVLVRLTEFADENGRPSGELFDAYIAESTGRRVISTNLPGIDFYGSREDRAQQELTKAQAADLRSGRFREVGKAIYAATSHAASEFGIDPNVVLLGTSMSAGVAGGMIHAAQEGGLNIAGVTFSEPVNIEKRSPANLLGKFIAAGRTAPGYVKMNPQQLKEVSEPIATIVKRAANSDNFLYGQALSSGSLLDDIGSIDHLQDIPIFMGRGSASTISPEQQFNEVADYLSTNADVEAVTYGSQENPHDHGYVLAVQPFVMAAQNILSRR